VLVLFCLWLDRTLPTAALQNRPADEVPLVVQAGWMCTTHVIEKPTLKQKKPQKTGHSRHTATRICKTKQRKLDPSQNGKQIATNRDRRKKKK
jgi:hypothetical protein